MVHQDLRLFPEIYYFVYDVGSMLWILNYPGEMAIHKYIFNNERRITGRKVPELSTTVEYGQHKVQAIKSGWLLPDSLYIPVFLASRSYTELYEEYEVAGVSIGVELECTVECSDKSSGTACVAWSFEVFSVMLDRRDEESEGSGTLRRENGNRIVQCWLWTVESLSFGDVQDREWGKSGGARYNSGSDSLRRAPRIGSVPSYDLLQVVF